MRQGDIFRAASRSTDPATSHAAEAEINLGSRAVRMKQVFDVLVKYPGSTTGEMARRMFEMFPELPIRTSVESPHKRVADLEDKGLVCRGAARRCGDSGRECLTWWPTNN